MPGRLTGKVALITGAARGQGAAHAALFAFEGASVILCDNRADEGQATAEQLAAQGYTAAFTHLDVTDQLGWSRALTFARETFGPVTVLVNNAGIVSFSGAEDTSDEEWVRVITTNQSGTFYGMRAVIPVMREAGGGSIVNISSTLGLGAMPGYFAYQASKAAILMMTRAAAVDYAKYGIRVNSVLPGLIYTQMTKEEPEDAVQSFIALTPLQRGAEATEVSYGVLYLASDESRFVTGTELVIDGGYLAQ